MLEQLGRRIEADLPLHSGKGYPESLMNQMDVGLDPWISIISGDRFCLLTNEFPEFDLVQSLHPEVAECSVLFQARF